jgi:hypothetical protein
MSTGGGMKNWTQDEIDIVHAMRADGYSASLIGKRINKTRNSILGMIHRAKVKEQRVSEFGWLPKKTKKARPPKPFKPRLAKDRTHKTTRYNKAKLTLREVVAATSEPKTMMDLRMDDCRAIIGPVSGVDTLYCAAPVYPGTSWCPHHREIFCTRDKENTFKRYTHVG